MNKYHNVKTRGYDSRKEAERARVLHLLEKGGKIRDLKEQVPYELIPAQYETRDTTSSGPPGHLPLKGKASRGKLLERPVKYVADFVYIDNATGEEVVEDAKGVRTDAYIIKRKLMLYVYGIRIREV